MSSDKVQATAHQGGWTEREERIAGVLAAQEGTEASFRHRWKARDLIGSGALEQVSVAEALYEHQPSRWRSITTELEVLRCCGEDFGPATRRPRKGEPTAWEAWANHVSAAIAEANRG